jgi:hypothetical protein
MAFQLMLFVSGGNSFSVGFDGQLTSIADSLNSKCGTDFDEYVRRVLSEPFPYSPTDAASRQVTDLWSGRRLRIFSGTNWREGKVRDWTQSNSGPFSPITMWSLEVAFDDFVVGDTVTIDGLKFATKQNGKRGKKRLNVANKHNGKKGRIVKYVEQQGRYKIEMIDDKYVLEVSPENMNDAVLTFHVNRMNIEGGGTLVPDSSDHDEEDSAESTDDNVTSESEDEQVDDKDDVDNEESDDESSEDSDSTSLVSLEWLEPASPSINLDEGSLTATCPRCRAAEPPMANYSDAPTETEHECPICLETKQCRLLQCEHVVCSDCWTSWRSVACGGPVRPPMMDPEQLQKERAERLREVLEISPHDRGGTATKPGDSDKDIREATEKWRLALQNKLFTLIEHAHNGEEGLGRFWEELLVLAMPFVCLDIFIKYLLEQLDIPALEILLQVIEQRKDELFAHYMRLKKVTRKVTSWSEMFFEGRCRLCCNRIGEKYEEVKNYRGAIPWYERSVVHAFPKDFRAMQLNNLGLAQKKAGFLSAALKSYNASVQLDPGGPNARNNREMLLREMKAWTGSSGKLTPGC